MRRARLKRAQILLAADAGDQRRGDRQQRLGWRVHGLPNQTALRGRQPGAGAQRGDTPRSGRKLSGKETALLVATACSSPPAGPEALDAGSAGRRDGQLTEHEGLSRETVRRRLAEDDLKPWRRDMWCIPQVDGTYVARMEDVLDLYAEEADPTRPVVCFDESPTQLIGEVREPIPAEPGQPERYDCEYRRNGTANLFVFLDAHRPWRHVKVTEHRTARDFAVCMRDLADIHYPNAELIRVVMDNLSTHTAGSPIRSLPGARGASHPSAPGVSLHTQTRQLAQHGGNRDRRVARSMSGSPHRRARGPVAEIDAWQRQRNCLRRSDQMEVHHPEGAEQAGPRLSRHRQRVIITVQRYEPIVIDSWTRLRKPMSPPGHV